MKKLVVIVGAFVFLVFFMSTVCGQTPSSTEQVEGWGGVLKQIPALFKALQSRDGLPVLTVICNLFMALLKTKWFQAVIRKVTMRKQEWELTDAGKTFMALGVGVLFVWLVAPASTEFRTFGKGLMVGFSAIGVYNTWKHSIRDFIFKPAQEEVSVE